MSSGGGIIKLAASAEFVDSPGALPAFEKAYGFKLSRGQILVLAGGNTAATMRAAAEGISSVNAAMAYGTDGALAVLRLRSLADDKHAQTVYEPAPVIRGAVLAQHPEIEGVLDPVFRSLDLERLQRLNAKIAADGDEPKRSRPNILRAKGFLRMMPRHRVLFVLRLAAIARCALGGFVGKRRTGCVSGLPIMLWQADASMSFGLAVLARCAAAAFLRGPAIAAFDPERRPAAVAHLRCRSTSRRH